MEQRHLSSGDEGRAGADVDSHGTDTVEGRASWYTTATAAVHAHTGTLYGETQTCFNSVSDAYRYTPLGMAATVAPATHQIQRCRGVPACSVPVLQSINGESLTCFG